MFLHLSVILFTGGGVSDWGGLYPGESLTAGGVSLSRGVSVREIPPIQ